MGGKDDDDRRDELTKWIESLRADASKIRNDLENDLRNGTDDAASSPSTSPFERFKSFVDENISTLSEGFRRFPSNIADLKTRMQQEREARQEEERDIWRRWTGSEDSPDHIRMQVERASEEDRKQAKEATLLLLRESLERNKNVDTQKIVDLYRDNEWTFGGLDQFATPLLSFGGACYYKAETVDNLPSTARWGWPTLQPRWLTTDWFKRSAYSPVRLAAHPNDESGARWRAAFEELLCATLDKPMASTEKVGLRPPYGTAQSTYLGPGLDWMLSLQCRGILPLQIPSLYQTNKAVAQYNDLTDRVCSPHATDSHYLWKQLTPLRRDFDLLLDEVSIKSGPATQAQPLAVAVAPWRVPETEEELYEQMEPKDTVPTWEDDEKARMDLMMAFQSKDVCAVRDGLEAYYKKHGSIGGLMDDVLEELDFASQNARRMNEVLNEAAKISDNIPQEDIWRRIAMLDREDRKRLAIDLMVLHDPSMYAEGHSADGVTLGDIVEATEEEDVDVILTQIERDRWTAEPKAVQSEHLGSHNPKDEELRRPDILSQLTTTHTTRLPDGTVTTKVTLKQRFADGREEQHESVQTTHEKDGQSDLEDSAEQKPSNAKAGRETKNGWFWS